MHPDVNELRQLPRINDDILAIFSSRRITTIRELQELPATKFDALFGRRFGEEKAEIKHVLQSLPIFELKAFFCKCSLRETDCISDGGVISCNASSGELEVSIRLLRGNPKMKIHAPKYHKAKVATYWLIVDAGQSLLYCRRIDASKSESKFKLPIDRLPTDGSVIHAEIVSDSMMGISFSFSCNIY